MFKPQSFHDYITIFANNISADLQEMWMKNTDKVNFSAVQNKPLIGETLVKGAIGKCYHIVAAWDCIIAKAFWLYVDGAPQEWSDIPLTAKQMQKLRE